MSGQTDRFQVLRKLPKIRFDEELRGYNRSQVDRVLHSLAPLADEVDDLQVRLNEAETRAASAEARLVSQPEAAPAAAAPATTADFDETLRNTLLLAQRTADQTVRDANAEAERLVAEARAEAADLAAAGRRESEEIRSANDAARERLEAELAEERTERLAEIASGSAERLRSIEDELTAAHDEQRQQLLADIAELSERRSALSGEIDRFESHLAARREAVRSAIAELEAVADGDHGLQGEMPPEPADIADTDAEAFAPVEIRSESLNELDAELSADVPADDQSEPTDSGVGEIFRDDSGRPTIAAGSPVTDGPLPSAETLDTGHAAAEEPESGTSTDGDPGAVETGAVESSGPEGDSSPFAEDPSAEVGPSQAEETFRADDFVGLADIDASEPTGGSGIMLGEIDAGPAPDAGGPATEAVDVLDLEDDGVEADPVDGTIGAESHDRPSWDAPSGTDDPAEDPIASAPPIERPQWADEVPSAADAPTPASDPFLEELRRVTTEDDGDDDALARFLETDPEDETEKGGGWFGRRR